jgi:hypothetical protein
MRNRIAALLAALAIPLFAVLGLAAPAAAATEEINYAVDIDWYADSSRECFTAGTTASACVQKNGDDIWIRDKVGDERVVRVVWWDVDGTRYGRCIDDLGPEKVWVYCNKDWTEGHEIAWYVQWYADGQWWSGMTQTTTV